MMKQEVKSARQRGIPNQKLNGEKIVEDIIGLIWQERQTLNFKEQQCSSHTVHGRRDCFGTMLRLWRFRH